MDLSTLLPVASGPFAGSFLGVLIRRLPVGAPIVLARSACEGCGAVLRPAELVPLLSYAALRGRCAHCGCPIGRFHLAIELAATGVAAWAAWADPDGAWLDCVFGWTLLALAWIDWDHMRLPDALTLPLVLAGLAAAWADGLDAATDHAMAAAAGYGLFRMVAWTYLRVRGRDGLGPGDAKMLAAAGAWVGLAGLPLTILGGALAGLALAVPRGRAALAGAAIPFGPGLALAAWVVRLYGQG